MRIIIKSSYVIFSWAVGSLFDVLLNIPLPSLNVMEMSVWNKPMESTTATNKRIGADGAIWSRVNLSSPLFSVVRVRLKKKKKTKQTTKYRLLLANRMARNNRRCVSRQQQPVTGGYLPAARDWSCEPSSTCGSSIRFEKCVPLQSEESWHSFWFVCNTTTTKSKKFQSQKVEFVGYKNKEWIWLLLTWWLRQHILSSTTDAVLRLVSIFCYIGCAAAVAAVEFEFELRRRRKMPMNPANSSPAKKGPTLK